MLQSLIEFAQPTDEERAEASRYGSFSALLDSAQGLTASNQSAALRRFNLVEKLIYWSQLRSVEDAVVFESAVVLHSNLLRSLDLRSDAAELVMNGRQIVTFEAHPETLEFVAEWLAGTGDSSGLAMAILVDYIVRSKASSSATVLGFVEHVLVAYLPFRNPSEEQASHAFRILIAWPSCQFARYLIAVCDLFEGRYSDALQSCESLEAKNEPKQRYLCLLAQGKLEGSKGKWIEAANFFKQALDLFPQQDSARKSLVEAGAQALHITGKKKLVDETLVWAREAGLDLQRSKTGDAESREAMVFICIRLKDWINAETFLDDLPEPRVNAARCELLLGKGEYDEALRFAKAGGDLPTIERIADAAYDAIKWTVAAAGYSELLGWKPGRSRTQLGKCLFNASEYVAALEALTTFAPSEEDKFWSARCLLRLGRLEEAADAFFALAGSRGNREDFLYVSSALGRLKRFEPALLAVRKGGERYPNCEDLRSLEAKLLIQAGRVDEAKACIAQLAQLEVETRDLARLEAAVCYLEGEWDSARKRMRLATGPSPSHPYDLHVLGLIAYRSGAFPEAERFARRTIALDPAFMGARSLLAASMFRQGTFSAKDEMLTNGEKEPLERWIAGQAALEAGNENAALHAWTALQRRTSISDDMSRAIAQLGYVRCLAAAASGDVKGAVECLSGLEFLTVSERNDVVPILLRAALTYIRSPEPSHTEDARRLLKLASSMSGAIPCVVHLEGMLALREQRLEDARAYLDVVAARSNDESSAVVLLGLIDMIEDRLESAVRRFSSVGSDASDFLLANELRLSALAKAQDWAGAADLARFCSGDFADLILDIAEGLKSSVFRSHYFKGISHAIAGDLDEAQRCLELARRGPFTSNAANKALALIHLKRGLSLIESGRLGPGSIELALAREIDPVVEELHSARSFAYQAERNSAERSWTAEICQDPMDMESLRALGILYFFSAGSYERQGQFEEAARAWIDSAACWSLIVYSADLHQGWATEKSKRYGRPVTVEHVRKACDKLGEQLLGSILKTIDRHRDSENVAKVLRLGYAGALGEFRAASLLSLWAARTIPKSVERFQIGGPRSLERYGGGRAATEFAAKVMEGASQDPEARRLNLAYCGRSPEWELVEARMSTIALEKLRALPNPGPEQRELIALACDDVAIVAPGGDVAFAHWGEALKAIDGVDADDIAEQIRAHMVARARSISAEARKISTGEIRSIVVAMREIGSTLDLPEFRREQANIVFALVRRDRTRGPSLDLLLEEVLQLDPGHESARRERAQALVDRASALVSQASGARERDLLVDANRALLRALELDRNNQDGRSLRETLLTRLDQDVTLTPLAKELREVV